MPAIRSQQQGFNLVEILIALVLLAMIIAMSAETSIGNVSSYQQAQNAMYARWVAANQVVEVQLKTAWPDTGTSKGESTMGNVKWTWVQTVSNTSKDMRKLEVVVYDTFDKKQAIAIQTAYLSKPAT
jgi:type II secretion system protein I